jgi:hypothetical protein
MKKHLCVFVKLLVQHNQIIVGIIFILTILVGAIYTLYLGDSLRFLPDEKDYLQITGNIISKGAYSLDGTTPTAYRAPGYPLLLVLLEFMGAEIKLLRFTNFILLGLSILAANAILNEQGKPLAGVLAAGWLSVGYPVLFYSAGTFYPQTLAGCLLILGILLVTRKTKHWIYTVLAGLVFGWLVLTVPILFILVIIIALWYSKRRDLKHGLVLLGITVMVVLPWSVRNAVSMNSLVLITTGSGENLLLGNSPHTTPAGGAGTDISLYWEEAQRQNLNEIGRDRFYRNQALSYICENPAASVKMFLLKLLNYFNFRNQLVTASEASVTKDLVMLITYAPLLLGFFGSLFWQKWGRLTSLENLLAILYLSNGLVYAVFFTRLRFRLPLDGVLILLSASFLGKVIGSYCECT